MEMVRSGVMTLVLTLLAVLPGWAQTPLGTIKAVKSIPINGVRMIETEQGIFFASDNGRFLWKGPIFDMWSASKVETLADVDEVAKKVNLQKIGVDFSQLAVFTLGDGAKEVTVFVSPACPHCRELLEQATNLAREYQFKVVLLPLGSKDMDIARRLVCLPDKGKALQALVSQKYEGLPPGSCPLTSLQKNLVTARVLGITSVPYLVRHDGLTNAGKVKDLAAWLADGKSQGEGGK
jgi:thiol:disulfide interchange protein DsbC